MDSLSKENKISCINDIMSMKFGALLDWEPPTLQHEFGPSDLDLVEVFAQKLADLRTTVFTELEQLSDQKLSEAASKISNGKINATDEWYSIRSSEIRNLLKRQPPTIAFGFGHPQFAVDFEYWGKLGQLSLHEVALISVGANPVSIEKETIEKLKKIKDEGKSLYKAQEFLLNQHEVFRRHFRSTGYGYLHETIASVKALIDHIELDVHPEFYAVLEQRTKQKELSHSIHDQKSMTNQERESLLKLIAAMACEQYAYNPANERSEAPSRIRDDIEQVGLNMDSKTIRKWLKEASSLVAPDYWTKD